MKKVLLNAMLVGAIAFTACKKDDNNNNDDKSTATEFDTTMLTLEGGLSIREVSIKDNGEGVGSVTFEKNTVYLLDGRVFVNSGQTLTIEAGTVIKGEAGQNESASALVVARGAKIMAEGTASEPIIMTAKSDATVRYTDGTYSAGDNLSAETRGQWGGLIVLGNATINEPVEGGESSIEGIPTSEPRGLYGGSDNADNSGVLNYISIRHGGTDIGAGNEINGLTLGGVGSATEIDYIEVIGNNDDGIEFFGGTPRVKHFVVYSNGDDAFDWDQGFRGYGQFWVAVSPGDRGAECDGDDTPGNQPFSQPTVTNLTFIGTGGKPMTLRENSGGYISNAIMYNFKQSIDFQAINTPDSKDKLEAGDAKLTNVYYSMTPGGQTAHSYDASETVIKVDLSANVNVIGSVNSDTDFGLSLSNLSYAGLTATASPSDAWFTQVSYVGAFDPASGTNGDWLRGWTFLDERGLLD